MGLKSFLFRHSGVAKRLQAETERLKAANAELKTRLADQKARPPRRPLDSAPEHENALRAALQTLASDESPAQSVRGWPGMADRVGCAVSASDIMLVKANARSYAAAGLSALACIQQSLEAAAREPRTILDFGCGFGRVLRFLRAAYPEAVLFCTDMDAEGLGFCTHHFNTLGFRTDLEHGPRWLATRFDLIWVGSVFTHLDTANCRRLLRHLADFLAPDGLVVFTTHGQSALARMKARSEIYRLAPATLDQIVADCEKTGLGYADYPDWPGYGVSAMTTPWVDDLIAHAGLTRRLHLPAGWAAHQDVFAAQAPASPS